MRHVWTRNELVAVLKLYCETPFGKIHNRNKLIISLASVIGRTPSAVALKMSNFAGLDPTIDRKGMANASAFDREIWDEFFADIDHFLKDEPPITGFEEMPQSEFLWENVTGLDKKLVSTGRINQHFFRRMILASYGNSCAISGICEEKFLIAGHIVPWATRPDLRMNPFNGICLNALHDKAFDCGFISISDHGDILYSRKIEPIARLKLENLGGPAFKFPTKFRPTSEFIDFHRSNIFQN